MTRGSFLHNFLGPGHRSLIPATIAFACGIGLAPYDWPGAPWDRLVIALLAVGVFWGFIRANKALLTLLLLPLFLLTGYEHAKPRLRPPTDPGHIVNLVQKDRQEVVLMGVLAKSPERRDNRTRLLMAAEEVRLPADGSGQATHGLVQLTLNGEVPEAIKPGERFMARAVVSQPNTYKVPGIFDYKRFLGYQAIRLTGWVGTPAQIIKVRALAPPPLLQRLRFLPERLRHEALAFLVQNLDGQVLGLYQALLTGDRSALSPATLEQFQATGAMHLLAISGMHLGLLALLVIAGISWLFKRSTRLLLHLPVRKAAALAAIPLLLGYALITGLQPPTFRALIMILVFLAAILLDKNWCSLTNLAMAALLILWLRPASLFTPSFQLSFAAVTAIILLYPRFGPCLDDAALFSGTGRLSKWLFASLVLSVIATVGTAPLLAFYFNRLSLLSPITTLLVAPILCFWALPIGLFSLGLAPVFPHSAAALLALGSWGIVVAEKIVALLARLPAISFWLPSPTPLEIFCFFAGLLAVSCWRQGRVPKYIAISAFVILAATPTFASLQKKLASQPSITFLDVGQGSATVLELPHGKTFLIDGGGAWSPRFDVGKKIIAPYLWKKQITRLDGLVITHPHADHYNGLPFILSHFRPKTLWVNGQHGLEPEYARLLNLARKLRIPVKTPHLNDILFQDNDTVLAVLQNGRPRAAGVPDEPARTAGARINNHSLVLRLSCRSLSCLLPGDIEEEAEKRLLAAHVQIKSDILLAPHHGSKTSGSTAFMRAVQPRYVVVSAGRLQHIFPDRKKLAEWRRMGVRVLTTAKEGTSTFTAQDGAVVVKDFQQGEAGGKQAAR